MSAHALFHHEPKSQREIIFQLMKDGKWRTIREIAQETNFPETSVSARLRDFRKTKFGYHRVDLRRYSDTEYQYRVVINEVI